MSLQYAQRKYESDYDFGYRIGFADERLRWYELSHYSPEFRAGYTAGKNLIDRLADDAAQSRCFG